MASSINVAVVALCIFLFGLMSFGLLLLHFHGFGNTDPLISSISGDHERLLLNARIRTVELRLAESEKNLLGILSAESQINQAYGFPSVPVAGSGGATTLLVNNNLRVPLRDSALGNQVEAKVTQHQAMQVLSVPQSVGEERILRSQSAGAGGGAGPGPGIAQQVQNQQPGFLSAVGAGAGGSAAVGAVSSIAPQYASKHRILTLSEEEFRGTDVGEMLEWYGPTSGGGSCEKDYGKQLVRNWRNAKRSYCSPGQGQTQSHVPVGGNFPGAIGGVGGVSSSVECHLIHQTGHAGGGDNLCSMRNVRINFKELSPDLSQATQRTMRAYVQSRQEDQAYVHFSRGLVAGQCDIDRGQWRRDAFPGWNEDWLFNGFQATATNDHQQQPIKCDKWWPAVSGTNTNTNSNVTAFILQRDTFANFFHDSEDFLNSFIAMAVLRLNSRQTQFVLTDLYPRGPFWSMWSKVFMGGVHKPWLAWDLQKQFKNADLCFPHAVVGIYGPASPIVLNRITTPCFGAALIKAYSDFVIRGMDLQGDTCYNQHQQQQQQSDGGDYLRTVTITWMARRSSVRWPERAMCDQQGDGSSGFGSGYMKCDLFAHMSSMRQLGRVVKNDAAVVRALKALEGETFPNGARVVLNDMDYNLLPFDQQIANDLRTDIMVGPHGAGFVHSLFMRDRAHLIELFVDGVSTRRHFANMARWYGRQYTELSPPNPVPVDRVISAVRQAINKMDLSSC